MLRTMSLDWFTFITQPCPDRYYLEVYQAVSIKVGAANREAAPFLPLSPLITEVIPLKTHIPMFQGKLKSAIVQLLL